ncbi:tryptophan synthase beta chain [bacterium BMS3Abin05]|nr:tryptophan synthase beta chain [bacterium BMS3Abin05]GBE28395.1 tryptophan synthase beta chain [bacterium BMS3Bbin03]HDK36440.1 TrpB-like pyridoxal phosphate-dependent enzyme [Bacteroidota bacterium]HDL78849.1 TrpB-like pyridoxal phosphate-dependent enzyme [Bacteroidota bacterium]HDZ12308.1 TrpB-like pyridoxal phosphate-dependent enzyme [Bacteroidota bacterium]
MNDAKIYLSESEMPQQWYNIQADLPELPAPALNPATNKPAGPDDLAAIFPMELIKQEVSTERYIPIPDDLLEIYKLWRPTPLVRAYRLEEFLETPARIYFKNESVSPAGSHKPNTAVAQAYFNMKEGNHRLATETGAGQWGSALSFATRLFDMECTVYMVKVSFRQKPFRKSLIHLWGAEIYASPSENTAFGRKVLAKDPNSLGSLGIAISEAIEDTVTHPGTKYSLGSVLNHVLLHQTIIGQEVKKQFEIIGDYPDTVIGCVGGGSNFSGLAFPFLQDKISGKKKDLQVLAIEPASSPSMTKGYYRYDYGDSAGMTPLMKMHTLGHNFMPPGIHAGGLRYHGMAPLVSLVYKLGLIEARSYHQLDTFKAGIDFARIQGIVPAPETDHAILAAIDEALKCKKTGEEKAILFNFSGHGHFDMTAYDDYLAGKLENYAYPKKLIEEAMKDVPQID